MTAEALLGGVGLLLALFVLLCLLLLSLSVRSRFSLDLRGWLGAFAAAAAATAFALGLWGYSFQTSDYQAAQLPLVQRLADPGAYPGDPYVDTAREFPSGVARLAAGALRRGRTLARVAWDFHVAALLLTFFAFFFLCGALFGDLRGACLATALLAVSQPLLIASPLALEVVAKDHFDATEGVWPLALFALTYWAVGNTAVASALAGAICYLHPLLGVLLLATIGAAAAAEAALDRRRSPGVLLAFGIGPGLAVSLPFWLFRADPGLLRGGADLAAALKSWYPLTVFASSWTAAHWAHAAGILALAGQALWRARTYEDYRFRFPALLLGLAALWLGAFAFTDLVPLRPVLLAQLFRTDSFLVILALAVAGHQIHKYWVSPRAQTWALGGLLLLALSGRPAAGYLLLVTAAWGLCEWASEREFEAYGPWLWRGWLAALAALGLWSLGSLALPGRSWALGPDRSLGTLLTVALAGLGAWRPALCPAALRRAAALGLLLLAFLPAGRVVAHRFRQGTLESAAPRQRDAAALAAALLDFVGPQDRFLTPPSERFRLLLGRSVVFEWLDGIAMQWAPGFEELWLQRLQEFRIDPAALAPFWALRDRAAVGSGTEGDRAGPVEEAYRRLGDRDLAALAERHEAAFVVTFADQKLDGRYFAEVAANRSFRAYQYKFNYPTTQRS